MSKSYKREQDYDRMDRLKHENKNLKRALKAARKTLDRFLVAEKVGLFDGEKVLPSKKRKEENSAYEKWECYNCKANCKQGRLEIVTFGNRFVRICNTCGKRTKSQVIYKGLRGIMKDGSILKGEE